MKLLVRRWRFVLIRDLGDEVRGAQMIILCSRELGREVYV
jgi:hypothetical protein